MLRGLERLMTEQGEELRDLPEAAYRRRIRAWTMYDWANSAFATTILAAVLPVYYSQVAGATLPSASVATAYWSFGLSLSLLVAAVLSPILGTVSDVLRGKKRFLAAFAALGIAATALLVLVETGDWLLASFLFIVARIGFSGANVFYDSLLPHVARPEDQDRVSARGYAMGYLGGGLLLATNVGLLSLLPGTLGPRLSFLSVAVWWAAFSIPLFRIVPEPFAASGSVRAAGGVLRESFRRLGRTLRDIREYRHLFKFLLAFLIYNDGIGTIIGVASIYGAELGFGRIELVLALLIVQFVGIPYSLIFGNLPRPSARWRPQLAAFVLFHVVALPALGGLGRVLLPGDLTGAAPPPYRGTEEVAGQGTYPPDSPYLEYGGAWSREEVASSVEPDAALRVTDAPGARVCLRFHGRRTVVVHGAGPDHGIAAVELDGRPLRDSEGEPILIDGYRSTPRRDEKLTLDATEAGEHVLCIVNQGRPHARGGGTRLSLARIEVLPPARESDLGLIFLLIVALEAVAALTALLAGWWAAARRVFSRIAARLDTRGTILLALCVYGTIAVWGFFVDSVVEFWCLAWLVAVVQGGSQALSRSLYASLSPAAKSGEFFGFFGIMSKFSAAVGPLIFASVAAAAGSSRPAIVSIVALFIVGGWLLLRVDVEEGRRIAREEDASARARG